MSQEHDLSLAKTNGIIKEEELLQLNEEAEAIVQKMNVPEELELDNVINSLGKIGRKEQLEASNSLDILKRPMKELMDNKNSDIPKTLLQLRQHVEELNPDNFSKGIKAFLNKLTGKTPVGTYIRKYQSVESHIEAIISSLLIGRDRLEEDNVELEIIKRNSREKIIELEKKIYLGRKLLERLDEESLKSEWVNKQNAINKAKRKIAKQTESMLSQVLILQQSIAGIDHLIDGNELLEDQIFDSMTITKHILTVSASIQMALSTQSKNIAAVQAVKKANEEALAQNAKLLRQNTEEIIKNAEDPTISLDVLRQSFNDVYASIKLSEESNERIVRNSKQFIVELDRLNVEMKQKLADS